MSGSRRHDPKQVPDRWLHCPRKSSDLINQKFLAFKAPLSSNFDERVPKDCQFHPEMLLDICKLKKINIGLWIDLTNTTRFYDKNIIERNNIIYQKIQCRGHGETPTMEQAKLFVKIVSQFIANNPLKHIGVHCTHGFNRTGFMIVSYLVEHEDYSLPVALNMFSKMRPPGIYKEDYLLELYQRFDDVEDTPPAPSLPDWCFDEESSDAIQDYSHQDTSSTSTDSKKKAVRTKIKNAKFMDGIPNVHHFTELPKAHDLQLQVQRMCKWKDKGFPGSQPVSMDKNNLCFLGSKSYRVSWKADGTRYMMLIDKANEIYFFDRDHSVFKVEGLRFPCSGNLRDHVQHTLVDGEMVIDKVNGKDIPRFLVYDIVTFQSEDVSHFHFYPDRLEIIENELIKPRYAAMEKNIINKSLEPFSVRNKQFWDITQTANLLGEKFAAQLSHEPDGLIFQPSKEPYMPGRCLSVLKWKPLSLNSVDFRLKIINKTGMGLVPCKEGQLFVGQRDDPFGSIKITKDIRDLSGKIIECKYEDGQWKFMRERTDKSYPNSFNTAAGVCGSIKDPITKENLLSYIEYVENQRNRDASVMPPPQAKRMRRS